MPQQIDTRMSLDIVEEEILHTRAALRADPDAADLVPLTEGWMPMVEAARGKQRVAREAQINADALRGVANKRLDGACARFGYDLEYAVHKNRSSPRFKQFFSGPISRFVRRPLAEQVSLVRSWLNESSDEVLLKHKAELETWSNAVMQSIEDTAATGMVRGEAWIAREQLAENLTRARDGLYHELLGRAQDRELPRGWANVFFRTRSRRHSSAAAEIEPAATTSDTSSHVDTPTPSPADHE